MTAVDNTFNILNLQFTDGEHERQLLTFQLAGEEFGLDVVRVQEIIRYIPPAKIPNAPKAIRGVINFRGEVIPVLDLRERFNLECREYDEFTVFVILEFNNKTLAIAVDQVTDIINIHEQNIHPTPELHGEAKNAYLKGIGRIGERMILLLDMEQIMDLKEKEKLDQAMEAVN